MDEDSQIGMILAVMVAVALLIMVTLFAPIVAMLLGALSALVTGK